MNVSSFLADTNIVSEIMKKRPNVSVLEWLRKGHKLYLSGPVLLELQWGICSVERRDPEEAARLRGWLDALLEIADHEVLTASAATLSLQAEMMAGPDLSNLWMQSTGTRRRPPGQDLAIAAIAIEHHLPVVTHNTRDFLKIHESFPLPGLFSPATRVWSVPRVPRPPLRRAQVVNAPSRLETLRRSTEALQLPWAQKARDKVLLP